MNFMLAVFKSSYSFTVQMSQLYKSDEIPKISYTLNRTCLWTTFRFKMFFRIPGVMVISNEYKLLLLLLLLLLL